MIYRAARGDLDKIRSYLSNCKICAFREAGLEEITYLTARRNIELLKIYLRDCRICDFKSIALLEINRLEREQEETIYRAARGDIDKLQSYLSSCKICAFKDAALEEITYYTARGNIELLRIYLRDCRICEFKSLALTEINKLTPPIPPDATSAWLYNGSTVYLALKPNDPSRKFYYDMPKPAVEPNRDGRLLFDGTRKNKEFVGTVYRYWKNCRTEQFEARGSISSDEKRIVLRGRAPQKNADCDLKYAQEDLVFEFKEMLAGCAEVLKTPDGFLNLREGPGIRFKILVKLAQGDVLHIDKAQCSTLNGTSVCDDEKEWTHVTSIPRIDKNAINANRLTSGWVTNRYIQLLACP